MNLRKQKRELAMAFAHEVFQGRTRSGLTQHAVADQAFISLRWYQKIEKGEVLPGFFSGRLPDAAFPLRAAAFSAEVLADVFVSAR